MTTAPQAQAVIDGLRAAGVARSDFRVRTERIARRDRGVRYVEYGDAVGVLLTNRDGAHDAVIAALEDLIIGRHLNVILHASSKYGYRVVTVASGYNRSGTVTILTDGRFTYQSATASLPALEIEVPA